MKRPSVDEAAGDAALTAGLSAARRAQVEVDRTTATAIRTTAAGSARPGIMTDCCGGPSYRVLWSYANDKEPSRDSGCPGSLQRVTQEERQ